MNNKHLAMYRYIAQYPGARRLFFNAGVAENDNIGLEPIFSDAVVKQYVDGSAIRCYDFAMVVFKTKKTFRTVLKMQRIYLTCSNYGVDRYAGQKWKLSGLWGRLHGFAHQKPSEHAEYGRARRTARKIHVPMLGGVF